MTRNKRVLVLAAVMLLTCATSFAQYTDRTAFNLNGPVKSVNFPEGELDDGPLPYTTLTFTRAGKIATLDDEPLKDENSEGAFGYAERDAKGVLSAYYEWTASGHCLKAIYTYNAQGRIAEVKYTYDDKDEGTHKLSYDTNGNLTKKKNTVFTIMRKDSHGNWLFRSYKSSDPNDESKVLTVVESRTIEYYEEAAQADTEEPATSDLRMHELKGKVKSMRLYNDETESGSWVIGFSQQGKWITTDDIQLSAAYSKVSRDSKGRILSTLSGENDAITKNTYTYDAQGYVVECETDLGIDGYSKENFTYNTAGDLVKSRLIENMGYDAPDEPEVSISYTILARDSHGNWTRRKVSKSDGTSRIQKRVITYYQ